MAELNEKMDDKRRSAERGSSAKNGETNNQLFGYKLDGELKKLLFNYFLIMI